MAAQGKELGSPLKVFNIPSELPFVDALAVGLTERAATGPFDLADYVILLPTRRAVRSLREAFLRLSDGKPLLLPRMMPLGDLDEEELAIAGWEELPSFQDSKDITDLPEAISSVHRHLMLTKHIQVMEAGRVSIDQAARLASELARLLDQVQTEQLDFTKLKNLVPDDYAQHWQMTLEFLEILTKFWPEILQDKGLVDPAERRNLVMRAQLAHWQKHPPETPVIAAGSTGSIPATADLLTLIAALPEGAVVLPGLDDALDPAALHDIETHPQHGLFRLLAKMDLTAGEVQNWLDGESQTNITSASPARRELIFNVMRPASKVDEWRSLEPPMAAALAGVENITCPGPDEEAGVIALKLREALETPEKTAALVTPDRRLARRVASELGRWGIDIDDSAGLPLDQTAPGSYLRLTAELVAHYFLPLDFLALGKHPLAAGGVIPASFRQLVRDFEVAALRGPRPAPGIKGLIDLLELLPKTRPDLNTLLENIQTMSAEFSHSLAQPKISLGEIIKTHIGFAEALAASDEQAGLERLWSGEDGEAAASFIAELMEVGDALDEIEGVSYPALLEVLMLGRAVRPNYGSHPRLAIWGLLEARLQHADLVILGGLNEGTWPPDVGSDPWMSRPMRKEFGLPSPERRIGLTAHDFQQAFSAPEIVMTRSARVDGTPTVPSRWLMRLQKLLQGLDPSLADELFMPSHWLDWQARLDRPEDVQPIEPPAPKPPVAARPRKLSVTQIETWMRDPYAIYARHILGLRALPPLDSAPDAADYGTLIHDAMDEFSRQFPAALPADAFDQLVKIGEEQFRPLLKHPGVWAFWWPRFLRIATWFVDLEAERRDEISALHSEVEGVYETTGPAGPFKLTAKADRVDELKAGGLRIIDYKTGAPPSKKEVAAGFAPQLPLEAVIAEEGGFAKVAAQPVTQLDYWRLRGSNPAGEVSSAGDDPAELAAEAREGLAALIRLFDEAETPYEARPRPDAAPKYSDYEHLARVKEWSSSEGEEG
ncbi:MAG: double-strand break repair protein AddB [Rhodospirillaceae bacterium]|nr:double-strand break repair protein AddB [Rhodospirillaceae bacterium]MBT7266778.1 double-strand break repair protein AddB [Rhodospirillaceae bacterium]